MQDRRNSWKTPAQIKRENAAARVDGTAAERERRLAIKTLVLSPGYPYLKDEAEALVREPTQPTDGNSLIAYLAGSIRQDAIRDLFKRLESLASEIPDAVHHQSTRQTER